LAGAVAVGGATGVAVAPEFQNSVFPHPFGTLVAVLALLSLSVAAAGTVDRRSGRRYGGAVLAVAGAALVLWGVRLVTRDDSLRSLLETPSWRLLARSAHELAPVGWVAAGSTLVLAGIAILVRRAVALTICALALALVTEGSAVVTAGSAVGYTSHFASGSRFVDSRGMTLAVLLGNTGLLPLAGIRGLRHLMRVRVSAIMIR
jgi:hypothetical protein